MRLSQFVAASLLLAVAFPLAVTAIGCSVNVGVGKTARPVRGEPEFGEVVLATATDPISKAPVDDVHEFPSDAAAIHATIKVKNVKAGSEFRFTWKRGTQDNGTIVLTAPVDLHDNWVSGFVEPRGGIPPADDYSVDVLYNGELVSSATFVVR